MYPVFLLSMTGSITASTTIVFPFVLAFMDILKSTKSSSLLSSSIENKNNTNDLAKNNSSSNNNKYYKNFIFKRQKDSNSGNAYEEASFLSLGQAAIAGAMLLLISTAPNLITKATVEDFVPGKTISFTDWFIIGLPHAAIGLLLSWNIVFLILRPKVNSLSSARTQFKTNLSKMGKITIEEKAVLLILAIALTLWITPSLTRSLYHVDINTQGKLEKMDVLYLFSNSFAKIPEAIPALSIGLVKIKRKSKDIGNAINSNSNASYRYQLILNWNETLKAIDWNILFLFGGGLVLGLE